MASFSTDGKAGPFKLKPGEIPSWAIAAEKVTKVTAWAASHWYLVIPLIVLVVILLLRKK